VQSPKTPPKKKKGEAAEEEEEVVKIPYFISKQPAFPLLVELANIMSEKEIFLGGAVHQGHPSNPNKGSTCAYLMEKFPEPSFDFGKPEAAGAKSLHTAPHSPPCSCFCFYLRPNASTLTGD
jgi:hypothetical protein